MYLSIGEFTLNTVLVKEEGSQQQPIYYVSRVIKDVETRYSEKEKASLALMVTARRLRPHFLSFKVVVRSNYPLRLVLGRADLSGRIVKWAMELSEYDVEFKP